MKQKNIDTFKISLSKLELVVLSMLIPQATPFIGAPICFPESNLKRVCEAS